MACASPVGIVYDDLYLAHETGSHPENASRLLKVMEVLEGLSLLKKVRQIPPVAASEEEITAVHRPEYVARVKRICGAGGGYLGVDTILSGKSYDVALLSAGGALTGMREAFKEGGARKVFVLARPPGHHALPDSGMGFCVFNNVAIACKAAKREFGIERMLVVDWDVHHGNGTQDIFYDDPSVLYFSTHQSPHYPGTGRVDEVGVGEGKGFTVNVPLPPGVGDLGYEAVFREILLPIARQYRPGLILVSAGQDIHHQDYLGNMNVTTQGFGTMAEILKQLADDVCGGRLVLMLEGGYNVEALAFAVAEILNRLGDLGLRIDEPFAPPDRTSDHLVRERIEQVKNVQKSFWKI